MSMVKVKPLTSYMDGSKMRGPQDEPYETNQAHAEELRIAGLAERLEGAEEPGVEDEAPANDSAADEAGVVDEAAPRRSRRRS